MYFLVRMFLAVVLCFGGWNVQAMAYKSSAHQDGNSSLRQNVASETSSYSAEPRGFSGKVGDLLGDKMFDYFVTRFVQVNKMDGFSCNIKITHNLVNRELVSPKVYLDRGTTKTPPPYKIATGYKNADKKIFVFDADDKITRASFVAAGSMTYDIGDTLVLVIVWHVEKHGTFLLGDGQNAFYFAVVKKSDIKTTWDKSLTAFYNDAQTKMFQATTTGRYVKLVNKAADGKTVDFTIRTHMTNDKNAQLTVLIDDPLAAAASTPSKRAMATAMGMSALFTVIGTLGKMALRHIPTDTQSIVVTVQNDFADLSLEDPRWHLKQAIVFDSVPYEIPAQQERQITFKVPFAYSETKKIFDKAEHSAVILTYKIKGSTRRLSFTIWWALKLKKESNHYSVSLLGENIDKSLFEAITKDRESTGGYKENILVASQYLNYQCKEDQIELVQTANGVQTKAVPKIVRISVTMGDSTASNMVVNIAERKGNKFDIVVTSFQPCYEKK